MTPQQYVRAARVPASVAEGEFGPWTISRRYLKGGMAKIAGTAVQTVLFKITPATMHIPPGEIVMEDGGIELARHLPIWLNARGRVLVTGLGLGCVVRGLLSNPLVDQIDVIEIDAGIIKAIWPEFAGNPRCKLHHHDAMTWPIPAGARWDFGWHDLHDDDGHLQVLHGRLLYRFREHCGPQGAWEFPRPFKRRFGRFLGLLGARRRDRRIGLAEEA